MSAASGAERRKQRRIQVTLPITVRGADANGVPFEEIIQCYDVSRGGASFPTGHKLEMGAELEITIPRRLPGREAVTDFVTAGSVMRIIRNEDGSTQIGVRFIGPHFPTYVSETTS